MVANENYGDLSALAKISFITVIDLNMGYYTIHLTSQSSALRASIMPFGNFAILASYGMGISSAPDHFQARIDNLLGDLEFIRAYLDDVKVIDFKTRLGISRSYSRRHDTGLTVNVKKCKFAVDEANYFGYRNTKEEIMPQPEKIATMYRIRVPVNKKQLRSFVGLAKYCLDVWPQCAYLLAPLT